MLSLKFNSLWLLLFLTSCSLGHYGKLKPVSEPEGHTVLKPIFEDKFNSFLFKANIKLYTKSFSGLLLTKQVSSGRYRVIFTTEMGLKLFDLEFDNGESIVHYTIPQFDRPLFIKTIQQDIEILLMNSLDIRQPAVFIDGEGNRVDKVDFNEFYNYYFTDQQSGDLVRIERAKENKKKVTIQLAKHVNGFPNEISIQHHDIRLRIKLTNLKKS